MVTQAAVAVWGRAPKQAMWGYKLYVIYDVIQTTNTAMMMIVTNEILFIHVDMRLKSKYFRPF